MKEQVRLPLSEFIKLNEGELHGWIYIQPNPLSDLVSLNSACMVVNVNSVSRSALDIYDEEMKREGFIVALMEPWEFFGYIEHLKKRDAFEPQKVVDGLNYFIVNDAWPE